MCSWGHLKVGTLNKGYWSSNNDQHFALHAEGIVCQGYTSNTSMIQSQHSSLPSVRIWHHFLKCEKKQTNSTWNEREEKLSLQFLRSLSKHIWEPDCQIVWLFWYLFFREGRTVFMCRVFLNCVCYFPHSQASWLAIPSIAVWQSHLFLS